MKRIKVEGPNRDIGALRNTDLMGDLDKQLGDVSHVFVANKMRRRGLFVQIHMEACSGSHEAHRDSQSSKENWLETAHPRLC